VAVLEKLSPTLRALLDHHPAPGERNVWLYRVASCCRGHCSEEALRNFFFKLRSRWNVGRDLTDAEIERAVARAFLGEKHPPSSTQRAHQIFTPKWPEPNLAKRQFYSDITEPVFDVSPPVDIDAGAVIDALFPGGGFLCMGREKNAGATWQREHWRGHEDDCQFIVPNRMTASVGRNGDGEESYRCIENTGPREYLVIESDIGTNKDEHARLLSHLASKARLVMVVDSGGKSLHGWFDCRHAPAHRIARFMQYAIWLGADRHLWVPCQWVRMPGGTRRDGALQHVLYFNPLNAGGSR
jgi:hypothetical protein